MGGSPPSVTPEDLEAITRRAVQDAKRGDADGPAFIAKILGLGSLRLIVDPALTPPMHHAPTYRLDSLDDEELEALDAIAAKMLEGHE